MLVNIQASRPASQTRAVRSGKHSASRQRRVMRSGSAVDSQQQDDKHDRLEAMCSKFEKMFKMLIAELHECIRLDQRHTEVTERCRMRLSEIVPLSSGIATTALTR